MHCLIFANSNDEKIFRNWERLVEREEFRIGYTYIHTYIDKRYNVMYVVNDCHKEKLIRLLHDYVKCPQSIGSPRDSAKTDSARTVVNVLQKEMRPVALTECFVDLSLPLKDEISKKNLRFPFVKSLA